MSTFDPIADLKAEYLRLGVAATIRRIGAGRYEITKPRCRQIIFHRELIDELERVRKIAGKQDCDEWGGSA